MLSLLQASHELQLNVPQVPTTDYINTIAPENEPEFPGASLSPLDPLVRVERRGEGRVQLLYGGPQGAHGHPVPGSFL